MKREREEMLLSKASPADRAENESTRGEIAGVAAELATLSEARCGLCRWRALWRRLFPRHRARRRQAASDFSARARRCETSGEGDRPWLAHRPCAIAQPFCARAGGGRMCAPCGPGQWLTDPRNPLTWRSIVNRVWQYHFGRGLVETPNDFGQMGALPDTPGAARLARGRPFAMTSAGRSRNCTGSSSRARPIAKTSTFPQPKAEQSDARQPLSLAAKPPQVSRRRRSATPCSR